MSCATCQISLAITFSGCDIGSVWVDAFLQACAARRADPLWRLSPLQSPPTSTSTSPEGSKAPFHSIAHGPRQLLCAILLINSDGALLGRWSGEIVNCSFPRAQPAPPFTIAQELSTDDDLAKKSAGSLKQQTRVLLNCLL